MPVKRSVDETFFDSWTPESAYIFGLLISDGTITINPRGSRYVEFLSTDRELVDLFRSLLRSNHKISLKKRPASEQHCKPIYRIQIGNKHMLSRLSRIGLSRKSVLPRISKRHYRDFVRGFFDGDGCVVFGKYYRKDRGINQIFFQVVFTCKFRQFLKQLLLNLKRHAGIQGGAVFKGDGAFRLLLSKNDALRLAGFLYEGVRKKLLLTRKYAIFQKATYYFKAIGHNER